MKELIIASNNNGKIREIKEVLKDVPVKVLSLKDKGIDIDVVEDGKTFKENARKKSEEICKALINNGEKDFIVMADDSGLEVEFLNGAPGVYSARYSGEHGNDDRNNEKLLKELYKVEWEKRKARFVCQLSVIDSVGKSKDITGYVEGYILNEAKGEDGFGYDPLFFYEKLDKSFAEITLEGKNKISHRALALIEFKNVIREFL